MIAAMRFFTLALPLEVDGSPAPSPPARRQAFVQKCAFDRRAVGAVVVPHRIGLRGNNDRGRSDIGHDTNYAFKLARSVANAPNSRARTSVKLGC
jgi:hypothetical protein